MNLPAQVGCRVFQTAFHLALPILPYREPEILGSIGEIVPILLENGIRSVLLVTDSVIRQTGLTRPLEDALADAAIRCTVYDGTRANPTVHNVEQALQLYQVRGCKALIAFGGGSSMDCAKAVGARVAFPNKQLGDLKGLLRVWKPIPPLFAIPTTAGTGSEVTVTAVITDPNRRHKYTMNNFTLIPRYAVLDPTVTYTLPPSLTATTGMDALTHAVEAYIGRSTSAETRRLAREAVNLIFHNILHAYRNGRNEKAREAMLLAAYKAGIAFSKSYVGYIHAVAHSLGGEYNIPHGLANAVLMPIVLEEYGEAVWKPLSELAIAADLADESTPVPVAARRLIRAIKLLNARMGIPERLNGIRARDIPKMAAHAAAEANPLYPVPKLMNAAELEKLYHLVAAEKE